jgi:hypothetical protein
MVGSPVELSPLQQGGGAQLGLKAADADTQGQQGASNGRFSTAQENKKEQDGQERADTGKDYGRDLRTGARLSSKFWVGALSKGASESTSHPIIDTTIETSISIALHYDFIVNKRFTVHVRSLGGRDYFNLN